VYGEAIKKLRADDRYRSKMLCGYVGGSGKTLNQDVIRPDFIRTIIECGYRVALERYIFEVSSPKKSEDVLQLFIDGIADWEAKEPGARKHMVIAFGLFSMPPRGINKKPNVDHHVWMDRQMNLVANHPVMADLAVLNWWPRVLADDEAVRFVGKLYRHYAIEGKTSMLTQDPLFLTSGTRTSGRGSTAGRCGPRRRGLARREASRGTDGSRGATWGWAGRPTRSTSATRSSG
jgi:hypothetical protein